MSQLSHSKSPPGPGPGAILSQTLAFRRAPIPLLTSLTQRYGDIFRMRLLAWPIVFLNHPDYLRQVLVTNYQNYDKRDPSYAIGRMFVGDGLVTAEGEAWKQQHALVMPIFQKKSRDAFDSIIVDATLGLCERWEAASRTESYIDVAKEMEDLTLQILSRTVFKVSASRLVESIASEFDLIGNFLLGYFQMPFPPLSIPTARSRRVKASLERLDRAVYALIAERRAIQEPERYGTDILGLLLSATDDESGKGLSDKQTRDNVVTFMVSGTHTSKTILAWAWHLISQHDSVEEKLHEEVDRVLGGRPATSEDLPKLVYTRMIIDETLRIYPATWMLMRRCIDEDVLGDYRIASHTYLMWSPYLLHRHPAFWENPEQFRPERFEPGKDDSRLAAYVPFGAGPRVCIGKHVALMTMTLVIATIAQKYRLSPKPDHVVQPEAQIVLRPLNGLPMRLSRRLG